MATAQPSGDGIQRILPDLIRDLIQEERRFGLERQNQQSARRAAIRDLVIRYAKRLP